MRSAVNKIVLALIAIVIPILMFGQENVKLVTVCEVLATPAKFSGEPVAIVGRLDCPSLIFESPCWLEEDNCKRPLVLNGRTWPNKIWIQFLFPATAKSDVEVDPTLLIEKLSAIRKSTKLGTHRAMLLRKNDDGVLVGDKWSDQPNEWGIVYGRIVIEKTLQHYSGAGVALKANPNDLRSIKNDEYRELDGKQ